MTMLGNTVMVAGSLIESPAFISDHLDRSIGNGAGSLLVEHRCPATSEGLASLLSGETLELTAPTEIPPLLRRSRSWKVLGSSNGLFCLSYHCAMDWEALFLWNPATRESRVLTECGKELKTPLLLALMPPCDVHHGFGYDRVTDDYKIVRITNTYLLNRDFVRAEVFALSEGVWRKIPGLRCRVYSSGYVAMDGILYWVADSCNSDDLELVLSFRLRDEVFRELHLPRLSNFQNDGDCKKLTVYEESLCLMVHDFRRHAPQLELWVMHGGAGEESWTKRLSIGTADGIQKPLGCGVNGEILVEKSDGRHSGSLAVYEASNNAFRELPIVGQLSTLDCHFYVESLVPVNR